MQAIQFSSNFDDAHASTHVVIVGGGIAGLSAAFYLQRAAEAAGTTVRYTLIERDERLGGKIQTDTINGPEGQFVVEGGPDSFVGQKPWGIQLARDLGLEAQLDGARSVRHSTYVLLRARPRPMPEGMLLIVPTKLGPFVRSPLFTPLGKLRMALDLLIPARRDAADESLAEFICRRLGNEALDRLGEPLLAGIHSADPQRQSMLATFPRFRDLEAKHGSLIRGMLSQRARTKNQEPRTDETRDGSRASVLGSSPFVTLRGGVGELVRALLEQLHGQLLAGRAVDAISHDPTDAQPYHVRLDDGTRLRADAVILATPSFATADMVDGIAPALAASLRQIRYVTTATISLAFRRGDLTKPLDGFGLVIPQSENRRINALTMTSTKFAGRAPDDHTLVRVFVGGSRTPEIAALDDDALLQVVRSEVRDILGAAAEPLWSRIYRWQQGNPQYDVGHLERVDALEQLLPPGLFLAGSAYRGVGIPDCIRSGQLAAEAALDQARRSHRAAESAVVV
ncbi:MAG TPA: protoporphyrinogen oxidase [Roseiflexaceae bacterium]|nr:protoporphyrinogen oxidase [Roseiflexaceae bacterium]